VNVQPIDVFSAAQRRLAATSDTLRLGLLRGFECGELVDRIYANRPSGRFAVGALLDAYVLGLPYAEGLRARKRLLRAALRGALDSAHANGDVPCVMLDLGCGAGRYLVEMLSTRGGYARQKLDITGIDLDGAALRVGRDLTHTAGVHGVSFVCRDALNIPALAAYRPNIVVASGLFDHLDDERVRATLQRIQQHMRPTTLIFTARSASAQPRDLIEAALVAGATRARPPAALEAWTRAAGFQHVELTQTDDGAHAVVTATASKAS
jgi:SAM-dependent methyltransferase